MKKRKSWLVIVAAAVVLIAVVGVAGWKWHEQPSFCSTMCHKVMAPYVESWQGGDMLAAAHGKANVVCLDCHEPKISEQINEATKYIKGDYSTPLKKISFTDDFCLRCHESRDALIAKTANYAAQDGTKVNPHDKKIDPNNADDPHGGSGATVIACSTCHSMHDESPGIDYCFGCHHAKVLKKCTDCHDHK